MVRSASSSCSPASEAPRSKGALIQSPAVPQSLRRVFKRNPDIRAFFEQPRVVEAVQSALEYYDTLSSHGVTPDDFVQKCRMFPLDEMEKAYRFLDSRYRMFSLRNDQVSDFYIQSRELLRPYLIAARKSVALNKSVVLCSEAVNEPSSVRDDHVTTRISPCEELDREVLNPELGEPAVFLSQNIPEEASQMERDLRILEEMFRHPETIPQEILDIRL